MAIVIRINGDKERANEVMVELAESTNVIPISVFPGTALEIFKCPESVEEIVRLVADA